MNFVFGLDGDAIVVTILLCILDVVVYGLILTKLIESRFRVLFWLRPPTSHLAATRREAELDMWQYNHCHLCVREFRFPPGRWVKGLCMRYDCPNFNRMRKRDLAIYEEHIAAYPEAAENFPPRPPGAPPGDYNRFLFLGWVQTS